MVFIAGRGLQQQNGWRKFNFLNSILIWFQVVVTRSKRALVSLQTFERMVGCDKASGEAPTRTFCLPRRALWHCTMGAVRSYTHIGDICIRAISLADFMPLSAASPSLITSKQWAWGYCCEDKAIVHRRPNSAGGGMVYHPARRAGGASSSSAWR